MTLARLLDRAGELNRMGLDCSTCTDAQRAQRGCLEPPAQRPMRPLWTRETYEVWLDEQGERAGLAGPAPDSAAIATGIYDLAAALAVHRVTGDYWWACPASYARYADPCVMLAADRAIDATLDLKRRKLPPQWYESPTPRMLALHRVAQDGLTELDAMQRERSRREADADAKRKRGRR